MAKSRTKNAAMNATIGSLMQISNVILGFVSRTIFIRLLNEDYLGVNGLFTNVLTVLSFAELGIGSAIVFSLYKPIAENDKEKVQVLIKFYRRAYWLIGTFIFFAGMCLLPFLDIIIKETPDIKENIGFIYIIFLINTSVSYFFSYKKTLITADQKDYLVQIYTRVFQLIQIIAQTIFLWITHEYFVYLIIQVIITVASNVYISSKADKLYPYLREKNENILNKDETKSIFDNVKALFVYKFGSVILNGTDNIIISSIVGVGAVGIASNYILLMNSVTSIIGSAINSLTASVGNLSVKGDKEQIKNVMHQLLLICIWLYGFIGIGFLVLTNEFIVLWIGEKWILDQTVVAAIIFSLYINGVQYAAYIFRTTQGLFTESRWVPMFSAVLNIFLSIWWGKSVGLAGIFAATGISRLLTTTVIDPWLVYRNNFQKRPFEYYKKYFLESLGVVLNTAFQYWIIGKIPLSGWPGFIIKGLTLCFTTNIIFLFEFGWTKDFKSLIKRLRNIVK